MDAITLAVAVLSAVGIARGNQYPAGLDPQSCPNYPNCDNAILHGSQNAGTRSPWNSVGPALSSTSTARNLWENPWVAPGVSPASQYPAGVNPQSCPNYPNCDNAALHGATFTPQASAAASNWNSPPPHGHSSAQVATRYPAGVDAQSCPRYPYC